jgi:glycine cleavage system H protein
MMRENAKWKIQTVVGDESTYHSRQHYDSLTSRRMSLILWVLFCTACVLVARRFDRRRKKAAEAAQSGDSSPRAQQAKRDILVNPLSAILVQPGETWIRIHNDDLVSIGTTDFAADFLGDLATVALPQESRFLHHGELAWTLVSKGGRKLVQAMPIDAEILAANIDLIRDPGMLQRSPYLKGWILRVRPRSIRSAVLNSRSGEPHGPRSGGSIGEFEGE